MLQSLIALPFVILGLILLLAVLAACAFFVGLIGYGWLKTLAPDEELAALSPLQRRVITLRATAVVAGFWIVLLVVNSSPSQHRDHNTGDEAFAYWRGTLRRLAGLPAQPASASATASGTRSEPRIAP